MAAPQEDRIAIVGIGCRMPPKANSLAAFWSFLMRGGNALRSIRADRWDWRQYFDEDQRRLGKSYAPKAASLDMDLRQFDPLAFGMSPREAASLDPQQRLLLEVTWEAFEDAGFPLERMSGSSTGVFVGGFCLDHLILQAQPANRHLVNAHSAGGVMMTVLSNRISHAFNLKGPSLTVDTACSSSLVALHYACQSLRWRECDMALAGGVNAMMRPEFPIIMSKGHFLSHHGECHAFDESAAGYARGEGAGILLLKRLDDAIVDGDTIHAVVRASGVNQDGRTDGISLPNSEAQEALVRDVYARAGVAPAEVDYVEAHGTGTQAGDFAELGALDRNFAEGREKKLPVGSVKTNIGHLEAAAGVAGVLKTIGVLKHREVPKNLHFKTPNPRIPFSDLQLEVASQARKLPAADEKPTLYAAINSFGYGGTNAHVILESAPVSVRTESATDSAPGSRLFPFSASSEEALRDLAGKYAFLLGKPLAGSFADLAHTLAFRRSHLPVRMAAVAGSAEELRDQLMAASTGQAHEGVVTGGRAATARPPVAFVFTGMGPQWWGMGQELLRSQPVFAAAIDAIDAVFHPLAGWSLKSAMLATEGESRMARTELAQPANFAIQAALVRLWESCGIRPSAVMGHSVGEVTAAYVAGVYTLEEAVKVSFHRSRLQQTAAGKGSMLAVGLSESGAEEAISGFSGVSIAAINSFDAVTLSGDSEELKRIAASLEERGVFNKFLRVEVAYHSPQMDPLRDELLASLVDLAPKPAQLPLYSTGYGRVIPGEEWTADYWWHNVRQPVRFAAAIKQAIEDGYAHFLEIGPHPVLGNSMKECAAALERKISCFTSLRRAEPEWPRFLLTLGEMYGAGIDPRWSALAPTSGRFLPGPQYPWQRQTHWVESDRSRMERLGLPGPVYLNRTVSTPNPCWEVEINRNYFPFLLDHGVQDQTVFAGMGYIEAALALSRRRHGMDAVVLENVSFERVLVVDLSTLQYLVTEFDAEGGRFMVSSRVEGEEGSFQRHCTGRIIPQSEPRPGKLDLAAYAATCPERVTVDALYERLRRRSLNYGPAFRPTREVHVGGNRFLVKLDVSGVVAEEEHPLHPTIFDAALQTVLYCASGDTLFVPFAFEQFQYFARPVTRECFAAGEVVSESETQIVANVWLTDADGNVLAHARHISLQSIDVGTREGEVGIFHDIEWNLSPAPAGGEVDGREVLVLADGSDSSFARDLVERLPGAVLACDLDGTESGGRRRIVVLWGFDAPSDGDILTWNGKVIALFQMLGRRGENVDVTLVTHRARPVGGGHEVNLPAASVAAIGLVAQNEFDCVFCRSIDLDVADARAIQAELSHRSRGDIAYRNGERFECVLTARKDEKEAEKFTAIAVDEPVELHAGAKGRPDGMRFRSSTRTDPGDGEIEIRIHRAAFDEKDRLKFGGQIPPIALENTISGTGFGMEGAGVVVRAGANSGFSPEDRVVAMLPRGFRTYATIPATLATRIPDGLDMDAAAIPIPYATAWRGLVEIANLQQGERVLIHQGASRLGLAAIDIAQWRGAEIFATAESEDERRLLHEMGVSKVYSSNGLDFGQQVRAETNDEGVDVVLASGGGDATRVSLGLLRAGGRCIETGKKDIAEDHGLPMRAFNRNVIFASVDIDRLACERPSDVRRILGEVFARFESRDFHQRALRTFPAGEVREAFEVLTGERSPGTLLLDLSTGEVDAVEMSESAALIRKDGCYLVTGGTSGFGVKTAHWLASQGAGRIILASRSGQKAPGIAEEIEAMTAGGAEVEVMSVDVTNPGAVRALVEQAGNALRGIIHGAMVLEDAMMADLTTEGFRRVFAPKAIGALNIADAIEGRADLDFVVFYSSVSALVGNRGQTSYVAANALLDALAYSLRAKGIPAVSINWGALSESGVVARDERLVGVLASAGITGLGDNEALAALEHTLRRHEAQVGVFRVDWNRWLEAHPKLADDPRFHALRMDAEDVSGGGVIAQIRRSLADASKEQRLRAIEGHLQDVLAATLKMPKDAVPADRKLNELGVDSLMVLELSLGIQEQIGINFSAMEFLKGPSLQQLAVMAESRIWPNGQ